MRSFLRKILGINTLKFVLINPALTNQGDIGIIFGKLPVKVIVTTLVEDIKVIDSGIIVVRKTEVPSQEQASTS